MSKQRWELTADQLRHECDSSQFAFETTGDIAPLQGAVGQDRAVSSLEFGLHIKSFGYNVFVSGATGTGRHTAINENIHKIAKDQLIPPDWCYVHNFSDPHQPTAVQLPPGQGAEFAKDMNEFIEAAKREIPRVFEDDQYETRKTEATKDIQSQKEALSNQLQENAKNQGFSLEISQMGFATVPLVEGKPVNREEFEALPEEVRKEIEAKSESLKSEFSQALTKAKKLDKQANALLVNLDRETVLAAISPAMSELTQRYGDNDRIKEYLDHLQNDIIENFEDFKTNEKDTSQMLALGKMAKGDIDEKYQVNVLVCNRDTQGAPVVFENNPTYYNLFGRIDFRARLGTMVTGSDMIKGGSLHRSNHGYLVLQARDVLNNQFCWDALKRTLRNREARIENIGEQYSLIPTANIRPEPIPLDVKVVLIGSPQIYHLLYTMDEDFRTLFRVRADFSGDMDRDDVHTQQYAAFIASVCSSQNFYPFDRTAVAKIVEQGSRLAEDQKRLSANFSELGEIISEANHWANLEETHVVIGYHVDKAIRERVYRSSLIPDRISELIDDGIIMIGTKGAVIGQVNGLSVQAYGNYHWGKPSRVTARTSVGRAGIVNIERETQMSGRIHNKGFLTLAGYITGKYGAEKPISLSGSVTFEQMYDEVDGDSASSTELYALLSSLSGLPLKQNLAVTGSVNQHGEVQAIGGVTAKIEGFFDVCKAKGLTGEQGVIIPESNVRNLMLNDEVAQAVETGQFHIYAIKSIDEGIELLTGVKAGQKQADGTFEPESVHNLVDQRLHAFADEMKKLSTADKGNPSQVAEEPQPKKEQRSRGRPRQSHP